MAKPRAAACVTLLGSDHPAIYTAKWALLVIFMVLILAFLHKSTDQSSCRVAITPEGISILTLPLATLVQGSVPVVGPGRVVSVKTFVSGSR